MNQDLFVDPFKASVNSSIKVVKTDVKEILPYMAVNLPRNLPNECINKVCQ